ncbi:MAG TPA: carboxypeptidase regulatory-like domain-containing protein [Bacteroidota bacterium]|nr:carboxypeptidase regulatory-like domain-containing protein [Bacteroidota bacterium]
MMPTRPHERGSASLLLVALAFAHPAVAQQAEQPACAIHGKITVTRREETHAAPLRDQMLGMYSMHGAEGTSARPGAAPSPVHLSEKAVVYIESDELNRGTYPLPSHAPSLDQRNLQFHPQVLAVLVGTRVEFPNRDNLFHNVFSYSQPKEFDLGRYPRDDSRSVTFDRAGVVRVYCDIHSSMSATILVLRHPYFASPDDAGSYAIGHIPPGTYRVALWYDRDVVERKTIEVREGEDVELDFND